MRKKVLIILLSLLLLAGVISVPVLAASWKPEDKITITVRVFNPNTGGVWVVGTDYCTKGDEKIQSDAYRIPRSFRVHRRKTATAYRRLRATGISPPATKMSERMFTGAATPPPPP
ncbi:MAG: hypothetical protein L6V89_09100 [Oscillospiraceae bacterium]|nr:MAG: hypothetical protein L6V89_09100 [Oscillospiraceae bacterium]